MTTARGRKAGAILVAGILAIGCDGPTRPAPVAPAPPPPVANPLAALAGSYTLTIDIPDACAELPEEERRRTSTRRSN